MKQRQTTTDPATVRKTARALEALSQCCRALVQAHEESDLLTQVCQIIVGTAGYRLAWVGLAERDDHKSVRPVAQAGFEEGYLQTVNVTWADVERGRGPTGTSIRTGSSCIIKDTHTAPNFAPWRAQAVQRGFESVVGLPLIADGTILGAITIYAPEPDAFDPEEVILLQELADNLAYGMMALRTRAAQKRAEELLRESHRQLEQRVELRTRELAAANQQLEMFHRFAEASGLGFGMADLDGYITYWNPTLCRLFGEDRPEDAVGKHVTAYFPKEYFEKRQNEILPVVMRDGRWQGELVVYSLQGKVTPILQHMFLIRDETGEPIRLGAAVTDITERKQAEEALRESEERYRTVVEDQTETICRFKADGSLTFVNAAFCRFFGKTSQELLGSQWHPNALPEDLSLIENRLRGLSPGNPVVVIENRVYAGNGDVRWMQFVNRGLFDVAGRLIEIQAIGRDVTERKLAEQELRASEERYDLAVRGAGVGIWDYDVRAGKVHFTPRWKTLFGYGEQDIGDDLEDWAGLLHPEERDWVVKFLEDFLAGTELIVNVEYRLRHKDGAYRWIEAHALAVRDEEGRAMRLVGSHADITNRKRAEEALERERRTLKHLLQSSDHERQLIAYEIHDDLAQQLTGAIMQFQVFDHLREAKPREAANAFAAGMTMLQQGHYEARRLIAGVRPPILDEAGIVAALAHLVNEQRREKGPKIEYASDVAFDRLTPILENAVYRIVQEALTNACRHSKSKSIRVMLMQHGERLRIDVRDHGVGFRPEDVGESRFGLEGIRERARLLGGNATIESTPGNGTHVAVELPVVLRRPEDACPEENSR